VSVVVPSPATSPGRAYGKRRPQSAGRPAPSPVEVRPPGRPPSPRTHGHDDDVRADQARAVPSSADQPPTSLRPLRRTSPCHEFRASTRIGDMQENPRNTWPSFGTDRRDPRARSGSPGIVPAPLRIGRSSWLTRPSKSRWCAERADHRPGAGLRPTRTELAKVTTSINCYPSSGPVTPRAHRALPVATRIAAAATGQPPGGRHRAPMPFTDPRRLRGQLFEVGHHGARLGDPEGANIWIDPS
jgi:hypothetical protein